MPNEIFNKVIPLVAAMIFICAFIFVRKANPENMKIRTRKSFAAIKRK